MTRASLMVALLLGFAVTGESLAESPWRAVLGQALPVYGHRNWIVIADAAYPDQTAPGITTLSTGASQLEVVEGVLKAISDSKHVRPKVWLDKELAYLDEEHAPGIGAYR